jgi:hypothetical protein
MNDKIVKKSTWFDNKKKGKVSYRSQGGRSGYPLNSGRVIQVLRNSGNENYYPITASKKQFPQIRVPAISGSGITRFTRNITKSQQTLKQHRILHRTKSWTE